MGRGEADACCRSLAERLAEIAAGGGDPGSNAEVSAHLAECGRCRDDLDAMIRAREAISRPDTLVAPAGLADRTASRVIEACREAGSRPAGEAKMAVPTAGGAAAKAGKRSSRLLSVLFRPIEHPAARTVAAAAVLLALLPLASVDIAEKIGAWQRRVMGEQIVAKIEPIGEKILDWYSGLMDIRSDEPSEDVRHESRPGRGRALAPTRSKV